MEKEAQCLVRKVGKDLSDYQEIKEKYNFQNDKFLKVILLKDFQNYMTIGEILLNEAKAENESLKSLVKQKPVQQPKKDIQNE